jgi:hypothetical protein
MYSCQLVTPAFDLSDNRLRERAIEFAVDNQVVRWLDAAILAVAERRPAEPAAVVQMKEAFTAVLTLGGADGGTSSGTQFYRMWRVSRLPSLLALGHVTESVGDRVRDIVAAMDDSFIANT